MKKTNILALLLVFAMTLALAACQKADAPAAGSSDVSEGSGSVSVETGEESTPPADTSDEVDVNPVSLLEWTENGLIRPVKIGTETVIDLDGDGAEETIFYDVQPYSQDDAGEYWEAKPLTLTINGKEFLCDNEENPFDSYGFWLENPDVENYYLVDLDSEDDKIELAVADWGSNDWLTTYLFRYENGELTYLGYIPAFPDSENSIYFGDGSATVLDHLSIMQTWSGFRTFVLEDGKIHSVSGEMMQPSQPWRKVYLRQELEVYAEPNIDSEKKTLTPSDEPVQFPLTDDAHWVNILMNDGTGGWIYFAEPLQMENGDAFVQPDTVFEGLVYAG